MAEWIFVKFPELWERYWEKLWIVLDNISDSITALEDSLKDYIDENITPLFSSLEESLKSFLGEKFEDVFDSFKEGVKSVSDLVSEAKEDVIEKVQFSIDTFESQIKDFSTRVEDLASDLSETVKNNVEGAIVTLQEALTTTESNITSAFNGALSPIPEALKNIFKPIFDRFGKLKVDEIVTSMFRAFEGAMEIVVDKAVGKSPLTPEQALEAAKWLMNWGNKAAMTKAGTQLGLEIATGGQLDYTLFAIDTIPSVRALFDVTSTIWSSLIEAGIGEGIRQYIAKETRLYVPTPTEMREMVWREKLDIEEFEEYCKRRGIPDKLIKAHKELLKRIPPLSDLVTMAAREAFDPDKVIKAPEVLYEYFKMVGLDETWTDRYWTAHFRRVPLGYMIDLYFRGEVAKDVLYTWFLLADYHPHDFEHALKALEAPVSLYAIRYAIEAGLIDRDKIVYEFKKRRYTEADAELAADAYINRALSSLITACKVEIKKDFEDGWIDEDQFKAELEAIGVIGLRLEYEVADSKLRRSRKEKEMWADIYLKAYEKDKISRDDCHRYVVEHGMQQWRIDSELSWVEAKKKYGVKIERK